MGVRALIILLLLSCSNINISVSRIYNEGEELNIEFQDDVRLDIHKVLQVRFNGPYHSQYFYSENFVSSVNTIFLKDLEEEFFNYSDFYIVIALKRYDLFVYIKNISKSDSGFIFNIERQELDPLF